MSIVMIKYGELNTKKDNRMFFIKTLAANIEDKLEGISFKLTKDRTRMFIEVEEKDLEFLNNTDEIFLTNSLFGIMSVSNLEKKIFKSQKLGKNILQNYKKYLGNI